MTREDIIRMANEVFDVQTDSRKRTTFSGDSYAIERFAAIVASAERERLAKVFDERDKGIGFYDPHEPAEIIRGQA